MLEFPIYMGLLRNGIKWILTLFEYLRATPLLSVLYVFRLIFQLATNSIQPNDESFATSCLTTRKSHTERKYIEIFQVKNCGQKNLSIILLKRLHTGIKSYIHSASPFQEICFIITSVNIFVKLAERKTETDQRFMVIKSKYA